MSALTLLAVLATATLAAAHMGVSPKTITPGGRATVSVTISHDCGTGTVGTSNFTIVIPDRFVSVKVEQTDGWRVIIHEAMVRISNNFLFPLAACTVGFFHVLTFSSLSLPNIFLNSPAIPTSSSIPQ